MFRRFTYWAFVLVTACHAAAPSVATSVASVTVPGPDRPVGSFEVSPAVVGQIGLLILHDTGRFKALFVDSCPEFVRMTEQCKTTREEGSYVLDEAAGKLTLMGSSKHVYDYKYDKAGNGSLVLTNAKGSVTAARDPILGWCQVNSDCADQGLAVPKACAGTRLAWECKKDGVTSCKLTCIEEAHTRCGYLFGYLCEKGQYCDVGPSCGKEAGTCRPVPEECRKGTATGGSVCACDQGIYDTNCDALVKGHISVRGDAALCD
jgi:hypothetical protein